MTAEDYYKLGNEHRRKGDWKHALDCYLEAIALDPDSPAVEAKQMLDRSEEHTSELQSRI